MTAELRDFARSILRMDGERVMWFERSQELAKKCDALTAEVDEARARRLAGPFSLINEALGASEDESSIEACKRVVAERDEAQRELRIANIGRTMGRAWEAQFRSERDAARVELAGVAAQRDAHLARSVELATRVAELETQLAQARAFGDQVCTERDELAALPPAVEEVDGFRVGDLVRHSVFAARNKVIAGFHNHDGQASYARLDGHGGGWSVSNMTRKPVEVGDTVRIAKSPFKWRVLAIDGGIASLQAGFAGPIADCIAVAP